MAEGRHYCTLFDSNYLLKGLVMLNTLARHSPGAVVHVLCMDEPTYHLLGVLDLDVRRLRLNEVEDAELLRVKPSRSVAEYCWTLSPALCWHVLATNPEIESLTYLDADLMFFSDVTPLFDEIGAASVAIIEHRFTPRLAHLEAYGRFNVEWVTFRRDGEGLECLKTWRDQCIEWCFARLENGRNGDQKYLDAWPSTYRSLCILQHKGAGVAPWNFANYCFSMRDGRVMVDDDPLIFHHFHQFQILSGGRYDYMSTAYSAGSAIPRVVYHPYARAVEEALLHVRSVEPAFTAGIRPAMAVKTRRAFQRFLPVGLKNVLHRVGIQTW